MATTNSWAFPNLFSVAQNQVSMLEDNASVVNRSKLLILTEPTELYNNPDFGVGLKRHLWQYNQPNQRAIICDRIKEQLRLHEPCSIPDKTEFSDGLLFTGAGQSTSALDKMQKLEMTVGIVTTYGDKLKVEAN